VGVCGSHAYFEYLTKILNQIIFYVGENDYLQERMDDLSHCALTCRSWREIAQPLSIFKDKTKEFRRS
jgi:hypothetical protein